MKIIEVKSPKSLDLTEIVKNKDNESFFQTIDVFDKVTITTHPKGANEILIKENGLDENIINDMRKLIYLFLEYRKLPILNLEIEVKKDKINLINHYYNILAGLLIALNVTFQNTLHKHELIYLARQINNLIGYYIECGYKKIDSNNKCHDTLLNPYNKYLIIDTSSKDELLMIRNILKDLTTFINNNYLVIPFIKNKENLNLSKLKQEFHDIYFINALNIYENKVLVKYLK